MQRENAGYAGGPPPVEVRELRKVYGDIVAVDQCQLHAPAGFRDRAARR